MHTGVCDNFYHSLLDRGAFRLAGGKRVGIFEISEQPQDMFHIFWAVHIEFLFFGGLTGKHPRNVFLLLA